MPYVHLEEQQTAQYHCRNPTWFYSTSLSTAPVPGELDPDKPTLFLIHCGGSSSASQQRQFHDERLRSTFNMIAMDAAFHGWSQGAQRNGPWPIERVAESFLAALDKLYDYNVPKFSILAEGLFGANCASYMIHQRPELIESLIFASPGYMQEPQEFRDRMSSWLDQCLSNKNGRGDGTGLLPTEALDFINEYYFGGSDRDVERQAIFASMFQQRYGAGHSGHDLIHLMSWFNHPPIDPNILAKIKVPVLILAGELDEFSPLSAAEEWRDKLTGVPGGAQLHLVKSAPHLLMYAESGVANRMVYRFLSVALKLRPDANRPVSIFAPN